MIKNFLIKQGMDENSASDMSLSIRKYISIFVIVIAIIYMFSGFFEKKEEISIDTVPTETMSDTFVAKEDIEDVDEDSSPDSESDFSSSSSDSEPNPGFLSQSDIGDMRSPEMMKDAGFTETKSADTSGLSNLEKQNLSNGGSSFSDKKSSSEPSSDSLSEKREDTEKNSVPDEDNKPSSKIQVQSSSFKGFSSSAPYSPN